MPLLDGRSTSDEIVARLEREQGAAEVYYALSSSKSRGSLPSRPGRRRTRRVSGHRPVRPRHGPASSHPAPATAVVEPSPSQARPRRVAVLAVGDLPLAACASSLEAYGLMPDEAASVAVVLTDSYLRPELAAVNALALQTQRPWLLAKPAGDVLWIGPLFRPGETSCWACLEARLRRNRPFEYQLVHRADFRAAASPLPGRGHAVSAAALGLLAPEIAARLDDGVADDAPGAIVTIDLTTGVRRSELVQRRPQCPACGEPTLYTQRASRPVELTARRKRYTADGGHRAVSPRETVEGHRRLVAPLTGVVHDVREPDAAAGSLPVCVTRFGSEPATGDVPLLDRGLRQASGKGMTAEQALASGLGEAIERYCCLFQGDEPREEASLEQLADAAIHPNLCMQFSEAQYAARAAASRPAARWQRVPPPLDPAARLDWTPVWSLATRGRRYLPTALLYGGYPGSGAAACCVFDPNGNASGNTAEEALLQALCELIERDSLAIWWYNRIRRPAVDLDAVAAAYPRDLVERYRSLGRELWVLDITTDLGVPSFAAVSRRTGPGPEAILLGFGAHLDAGIAFTRALTEMNQILTHVGEAQAAGKTLEATLARWLDEATLENQPYLAPAPQARTPARRLRSRGLGRSRGRRPLVRAAPGAQRSRAVRARPDQARRRRAGGQGGRPGPAALPGAVRAGAPVHRARRDGVAGRAAPRVRAESDSVPLVARVQPVPPRDVIVTQRKDRVSWQTSECSTTRSSRRPGETTCSARSWCGIPRAR